MKRVEKFSLKCVPSHIWIIWHAVIFSKIIYSLVHLVKCQVDGIGNMCHRSLDFWKHRVFFSIYPSLVMRTFILEWRWYNESKKYYLRAAVLKTFWGWYLFALKNYWESTKSFCLCKLYPLTFTILKIKSNDFFLDFVF